MRLRRASAWSIQYSFFDTTCLKNEPPAFTDPTLPTVRPLALAIASRATLMSAAAPLSTICHASPSTAE